MTQYYFLSTALPALEIGVPPEISREELERLLSDNLLPQDYAQVKILRRYEDLLNLRALWKGGEFSSYGNLDSNELSEALVDSTQLPKYVGAFLDLYETREERIARFSLLLSTFFKEEARNANAFLREYFNFERRLRLVLLGFRAKALGRNLAAELQDENPEEDLIAQMMAQKDAPAYEPPEGFENLKSLFSTYYGRPQDIYEALARYRFDAIEAMKGSDVFSFRAILGYWIQFALVERWQQLDKKKGMETIDRILQERP